MVSVVKELVVEDFVLKESFFQLNDTHALDNQKPYAELILWGSHNQILLLLHCLNSISFIRNKDKITDRTRVMIRNRQKSYFCNKSGLPELEKKI